MAFSERIHKEFLPTDDFRNPSYNKVNENGNKRKIEKLIPDYIPSTLPKT